jgi:hypothetical protein
MLVANVSWDTVWNSIDLETVKRYSGGRGMVVNEQPTSPEETEPTLVHEALLSENPDHLGDVAAKFATNAARAGEPLLVVLPEASHELVLNAVATAGVDLRCQDMSARGRNPSCVLDLFED